MQMHFLNTKILEEKCANCTSPFDKKNLRATKLKVSRDKSAQEMEIQVLDALAFICETSRNEFANTLAHFIEDEENETILPTTADSLTVALCCQCAPILTEMYNFHRSFNKLAKTDSIISKVKTFLGRHPMKTDTSITLGDTEEFGENLFDDLSYDANQILLEDNLDFRYEYDVLTDFPQLLPSSTSPTVKIESQETVPLSKALHPLTFSLAKANDDFNIERKRYSGGAKIGLNSVAHFGPSLPVPFANGRITRRMTRESEKSDNQLNIDDKSLPAATSTITHVAVGLEESENDFSLGAVGANEYEDIAFVQSIEVSNIDEDIATPSESSPSQSIQVDEHSTINIEQLEELSGSQMSKESFTNGNFQIENESPSSEGSAKEKAERKSKSGGRVPCGVCGQKICQDNMRGHMKIHAPVRETFKCELCDKVYLHKRNLKVHMKTHKQGEDVNCQYCNKIYPTLLLLKCHEEVHHGEEKPYCCLFCPLKFRKRRELDERPFNCAECGNNFKRKKDLRRHEKIHSDSRLDQELFKCKECGKLLRHSFSLYKHRVKYHRQQQ